MSSKPIALFRGDYYTKDEYALLKNMIANDTSLQFQLLSSTLDNKPTSIKRKLYHHYKNTKIYNPGDRYSKASEFTPYVIMYNTPLHNLPLHINGPNIIKAICQWRFQINK
jgi:hypothetical protein